MELSPHELKAHYNSLLNLHTAYYNAGIEKYEQLLSHGSERVIVRLHSESGGTSIGIVNKHHGENKAFTSFAKHFRKAGMNVPEVFIISNDGDSYLLEDLGDETLLNRIQTEGSITEGVKEIYRKVIDSLADFQLKAGAGVDYSLCYQYGEFGVENIDYDLNYFSERFLKVFYKGKVDAAKLAGDMELLKQKILEMPGEFFLYRDFQSRNIMLKGDTPYFIDFQSGRKGPLLYDTASLLYDAKADIPQDIRAELLEYYLMKVNSIHPIDMNYYRERFWYFAMIRILQAMGAYGYLGIVKGKRRFLESIPYAVRNINYILDEKIPAGSFKGLNEVFKEILNEQVNQ
ncbi:MAG: phosphotransferase [Ignavibacteria bacterium]|nr:phosphotransferase [Ignavibacteria bacterium]